jgi:hypothetical protein
MSTPNTNSSGWGWLILILVGISLFGVMRFRDQARDEERAAQVARELQEREAELRTFAEKHLPELQEVIDELQVVIDQRKAKLDAIRQKLSKHGVNVDANSQYLKWQEEKEQLQTELRMLLDERLKAFEALVMYQHSPDSDLKAKQAREDRLQHARDAAQASRKMFQELIRRSEAELDDEIN